MKTILFGTGDHYRKYKDWFNSADIVCMLDNDVRKQNTVIDGKRVVAPSVGIKMEYDRICIVSVYYEEIKKQLMSLGVHQKAIIHCSELHRYPEMTRSDRRVEIYNTKGESVQEIECEDNSILLMSHDLDLNGATLSLYYMACILKKKGYDIWFAAWTDGKVSKLLKEQGIGVIVDPRLQLETFAGIEWMQLFRFVFCNTLSYYQLLSDRDYSKKYVWWLHESEMFYQPIDKQVLSELVMDNLRIYAVGEIARKAFLNICPEKDVQELLYGIPDVIDYQDNPLKSKDVIKIISVGNVQEYKGQDVLVDALKLLPKRVQEKIHVSIIGGSESNYYHSVVAAAEEIKDMIEFVPPIMRDEVYEYYKSADLYICSSRQDCMPVVVAESMMYSLPSIVSDATGIAPYVEQGKCGLLFQNGNAKELSQKIQWCIDNEKELKHMGKAAREQYDKVFSLKCFSRNILQVVKDNFGI